MKYLTQLLGKRVLAPNGTYVGRVTDLVAELGGRLPTVRAVLIKREANEIAIPFSAITFQDDPAGPQGSGRIQGDVYLRAPLEVIPPYHGDESNRLFLRRDVLDRQIVDIHDRRVVRVSDVRLAVCGSEYCVVGVDASFRALLRRLGFISVPIELLCRLLGHPLRSNLIAWDDVQTLERSQPDGAIRLKVSHDKIARLHPADIADIVEQLSPQKGAEVIESLDTETAADTIAEAEPEVQVQIMQQLDNETATDILEEMEPDEAADVLGELPEERSDELLEQMEPEEARDVKELLAYDNDTAGGLMTTEFVAIKANLTCEQTIQYLRELTPKAETIYYIYVVDEENRLVGVLSLRDLVISPPETPISEIMVRNVIRVHAEDHADEVAQILGRYNLLAVPVVDEEERLLGIVTVDDTLERLLPPEKRPRLPTPALTNASESDA